MAYIFDEGKRGISGAWGWYYFKELLKTAGWTVPLSSDGTATVTVTGDNITTGNSGAGGLGNTNAWIVMRMPAVNGIQREFCMQMSNTNGGVAATSKYSFSAHFTGGSTSVTPTATDQQTFPANTWATADTFRLYIGCDNAAPFGAWMFPIMHGIASPSLGGGFLIDPIRSGTGPIYDPDPYVFLFGDNVGTPWSAGQMSTTSPASRCYYGKGTAEEAWTDVAPITMKENSGNIAGPSNRSNNIYTFEEEIERIWWGRSSAGTPSLPNQIKGQGTIMRWNASKTVYGKVMTDVTTRDRICLQDVNFPHNGSLVVL